TSIRETTLISGSSWRRGFRFMTGRGLSGGGRAPAANAGSFDRIGHAHRLLLHLHHDALDPAAKIAVGEERRDGHTEACRGGDQRLGDATGENPWITPAARLDGVEGADDARY